MLLVWRIGKGRISIKDNLVKRGAQVGCQNYVLCGQYEETTRHIFFAYSVIIKVWDKCCRCVEIEFCLPNTLRGTLHVIIIVIT